MFNSELEKAWSWRESGGLLQRQALRVFHGPGESQSDLRFFAVDRFGDHYWVTEWEDQNQSPSRKKAMDEIIHHLKSKNAQSVVCLSRPEKGVAPESKVLFGGMPQGKFEVQENSNHFWIQFEQSRHPGLFLDHEPLRRWLSNYSKGRTVLNAFAYTGSLSVAAALGKAKHVTTLDLSKAYIQWSKENFALNQLDENSNRWIVGDVFEWLPRLKREKEKYDSIILDPPSFSHGKKTNFSTAKDLEKLHGLAMDLLSEGGVLITSINSANISWKKYETDILAAARSRKMNFMILKQMDLPATFPTALGQPLPRYLKGWILKRV